MEEAQAAGARAAGPRVRSAHRRRALPHRRETDVGESGAPRGGCRRSSESHAASLRRRAVETAFRNFPAWSKTPAEDRIRMALRTAALIRERKFEFNAWLVFEAGKTWPEAEAEVAEAIDFCEYYAREMARLAGPQPVVQMPGERDEMRYLPLGVGIVIPPGISRWRFSAA